MAPRRNLGAWAFGYNRAVNPGLHLFDTALGTAGLSWDARGLLAVQLPERNADETRAKLLARTPDARDAPVPDWVRDVAARITAHLGGAPARYDDVPLALDTVPAFHRATYEVTRAVHSGTTASYGDLAKQLGRAGAARAIGQAMARNPWPVVVPCHRVLARAGGAGGFSAWGGVITKAKLLEIERVRLEGTHQPSLVATMGDAHFDREAAVKHLASRDRTLGAWMAKLGAFTMEVEATQSVYEAVARAVVYQQLTGRAAATIWSRVKALSGDGSFLTPDAMARMETDALRAVGLSAAKAAALKDLAQKCLEGRIPDAAQAHAMDDEALVEALTEVRGVGRWTVEMLLMFRLGRADVLPLGDYGVRNGARLAFGLREMPDEAWLARRGEKWKPFRSVASWYLWRVVDAVKGGTW